MASRAHTRMTGTAPFEERGYMLLALAVCACAVAVVLVRGTGAALALAAVAAVAAVLLPYPRWTLTGLVMVNLLAVSKAPLAGGMALSDVATPARSLLLALFALQAVRYLLSTAIPLATVLVPVAPLVAAIPLSLLSAERPPSDAINALPMAVLIASTAILAWPLCRSDDGVRAVVSALAVGFGAIAVLNLLLLPLVNQPAFLATTDGDRFQGILENPNTVGQLGFTGFPALVVAGLMRPRGSTTRKLSFALAGLVALEVVASLSRTGMFALAVAGAVLFLGLTRRRFTVRALWASMIVGILALTLSAGIAGQISDSLRITSIGGGGGSGRTEVWRLSADSIAERPILGNGYGSGSDVVRSFGDIEKFRGGHVQNVFLETGVELGLLGLAALLIALLVPIARLRGVSRDRLTPNQGLALVAALAIALGGLVEALGESYLMVPGGPVVSAVWLALGMCSALGALGSRLARRPVVRAGPTGRPATGAAT